eukprot:TRINITY_DN5123_c0_g1_i4.p1 TRINITY_DN5123_c0_g1~~TRINITY_DN5123_c0_g1_i4.p1  ORF type:complete len:339 (-),score=43.06 TRINITY_DN5123_c0_g1_i4:1106-2122(-)
MLKLAGRELLPLRDRTLQGEELAFSNEDFWTGIAAAFRDQCEKKGQWFHLKARSGDSLRRKFEELIKKSKHLQTGDPSCKPHFKAAKHVNHLITTIEGMEVLGTNDDDAGADADGVAGGDDAPDADTVMSRSSDEDADDASTSTGEEHSSASNHMRRKRREKRKLLATRKQAKQLAQVQQLQDERRKRKGAPEFGRTIKRRRDNQDNNANAIAHAISSLGSMDSSGVTDSSLPAIADGIIRPTLEMVQHILTSATQERREQREADVAKANREAEERREQREADVAKANREAEERREQREADVAKANREAEERREERAMMKAFITTAMDLMKNNSKPTQ